LTRPGLTGLGKYSGQRLSSAEKVQQQGKKKELDIASWTGSRSRCQQKKVENKS